MFVQRSNAILSLLRWWVKEGNQGFWPKRRYFSSTKTDVWLRGSGKVHLKTIWSLALFCLWGRTLDTDMKLKAIQRFSLWNSTLQSWRREKNLNAKAETLWSSLYWFSMIRFCVEDYVGFCKQLILFEFSVWENFRKSRGNACEAWMQLGFPTFLMRKTIGIIHLVVFTSSDEPSFRSPAVLRRDTCDEDLKCWSQTTGMWITSTYGNTLTLIISDIPIYLFVVIT